MNGWASRGQCPTSYARRIFQAVNFLYVILPIFQLNNVDYQLDIQSVIAELIELTHVLSHTVQTDKWMTINCTISNNIENSHDCSRKLTFVNIRIIATENKKFNYRRDNARCHSRSLKVIRCCANRRGIYDFILALNNNLPSMFNRSWDITASLHICAMRAHAYVWRPIALCHTALLLATI